MIRKKMETLDWKTTRKLCHWNIGFGLRISGSSSIDFFQPPKILVNDLKDKTQDLETLRSVSNLTIEQVEKSGLSTC